jgi:hypothetical protein
MKFPDPDLYYGADVAHWQRFLRSRGLYLGDVDGDYDSVTKEASFGFQQQEGLHRKEPVDDAVLEAAARLGYETPQPNPPGVYFYEEGRIELPSGEREPLNRLGYPYYLWTGKKITITSGARTPRQQAEAMYDNWHYRWNTGTHYTHAEAARDIREAYESSIKLHQSKHATIDAMTSVIENQVRRGVYISSHLTGRAVDVRTRDLSAGERSIFELLANRLDSVDRVVREENHDHLQFR